MTEIAQTIRAAYPAGLARAWESVRGQGLRLLSLALPLLFPLALLGLWQAAAAGHWISEQILPAPGVVYETLLYLLQDGELAAHLQGSLGRVGLAFLLAALVGIALGALLGLSRRARAYIAPLFEAYAQTPVIAWIPIGLLLFGISEGLAVALIAIAALVPVVMNTYKGVRYIPPHYLEVGRVYGFSRWQTLARIVAPAALPSIFTGLRYGLTQAWLTLVAAELVGIDHGLGALIVEARNLFQLDVVLVAILTLGVVGYALDKLFVKVERRLLHWQRQGF